MIQNHQWAAAVGMICDGVVDQNFVAILEDRDCAHQLQLAAKNLSLPHVRAQPDFFLVLVPVDTFGGLVADAAVQTERLAVVLARRTEIVKAARGKQTAGKAFQPAKPLIVIIGGRNIAGGGEIAVIVALEAQAGDIGAAVGRDGKFQPLAVANLKQPHSIALAADKANFFNAPDLAFVSVICFSHGISSSNPALAPFFSF